MPDRVSYAQRLSVFDATMLVMGGIIGAGIFLNPAVVAQRVSQPALVLGVWVLGGAVALAGAWCFAELGARKPLAGGGYVYLRDAFGPLPAFLYGWTELLVINSGGIAAVSVTFATYTISLAGLSTAATAPLAMGAIAVLSTINYLGIKPGSVTQNILTILKLLALAALIVAGLWFASSAASAAPAAPAASPAAAAPAASAASIGAALIPVLFAYGGWQSTNFVAAELKDARRDLPRAIILGVVGVVLVYLLANLAYLKVLGVAGLAASTAPASDVMRAALGPAGATVIALGIAASTFGFLNLAILAAPRVYQTMAADGVFFGRAADLHPRFRAPAAALVIQAGWAILLVATRTYGQLLDYVVFGDWIFFGLVGATLFYYRRAGGAAEAAGGGRDQAGSPEYRMPFYPAVPIFFVLAAMFAVVSTVWSNPRNAALGIVLIGSGIPAFFLWRGARLNTGRPRDVA
ncbi:MAG: amino acid permease [Gemmatimonadetes bacterium]|nr:amino acid permease [Gemmatimonadota bacterium]